MVIIEHPSELEDFLYQEIGQSAWRTLSQAQIQAFAQATGDAQWIHVDEARAKEESPFGTTIAHGFLVLSLIPAMFEEVLQVRGIRMAVNYGTNKVRFLSPVPNGARIRLSVTLVDFVAHGDHARATFSCTVWLDQEGGIRACLADLIALYYE
jgi:acyl dehydratase